MWSPTVRASSSRNPNPLMMLDTSYVIDLMRERRAERIGSATDFLRKHLSTKLRMPLFVLCELQLGVERSGESELERHALQSLCEYVDPVFPEVGFSLIYAQLVASLLSHGTPVPAMDALVAATALQHAEPLVTRDVEHFSRVDGLVVLSY